MQSKTLLKEKLKSSYVNEGITEQMVVPECSRDENNLVVYC